MGDLANMTNVYGEVNGQRLLSWLGRRAEMASRHLAEAIDAGDLVRAARQRGKLEVLLTMANDLAAELTPPDYPEDDGQEPERTCQNCRGTGRVVVAQGPLGPDTADCQACNGTGRDCTVEDDTVDLDDPALMGGPEEEKPELPGTILYHRHGVLFTIAPWPESIANPHGFAVAVIRGGEVVGGAADGADVIRGMRDGLWDEKKGQ